MSLKLDLAIAKTGTKFRIFPQPRHLTAFREPETIRVSVRPTKIKAGPADDRMYVVDAINKPPYRPGEFPPYRGPSNPPEKPGPDRHFDHLEPGSRGFSCAAMYATVRRVLDIWEDYFGREIEWHFHGDFERLELIPLVLWDNAHSGYGFLEFGYARLPGGGIDKSRPYCENFDVLAHELGYSIIFAEVGVPSESAVIDEYFGFHESAADLVAILSSLHSCKVVDHLLENSAGNLFTINELSRVGELSETRQIRVAFNYERMSDVSREPHDLSLPLTGAQFDIFVEIFQKELVKRDLITQQLADRSYHEPDEDEDDDEIQAEFAAAYDGNEGEFKTALLTARDYLGEVLSAVWDSLSPDSLTYPKVVRELFRADRRLSNGEHQGTIRDCLAWREISLSSHPLLAAPRRLQECGLVE